MPSRCDNSAECSRNVPQLVRWRQQVPERTLGEHSSTNPENVQAENPVT